MILRMQEGKELQGKKQRREKKTLSLLGAADGERSMIKIIRVIRMKNEKGFWMKMNEELRMSGTMDATIDSLQCE
jgi:hypothetical protein